MAGYYLDTSALVKGYVLEQGTIWVGHLISPAAAHNLYTIRLTGPEIIAALFRRHGRGRSLWWKQFVRQGISEQTGSSYTK